MTNGVMGTQGNQQKVNPGYGALGNIAGDIFNIWGGQQSPFDAYMQYAGQIPGMYQQQLGPYAQMGTSLLPQLQQTYSNLLQNPTQILGNIASTYQASPTATYDYNQALQAANAAAAAGGMGGTPAAMQQATQAATDVSNRYMQDYIKQALGVGRAGLGGLSGLEQQGYGASQSLANALAQVLGSQGAAAGLQAQQDKSQMGSLFGDIGNLFGGASQAGGLMSLIRGLF